MQCNLAIYLTLVLSAVCASVVCPEGMRVLTVGVFAVQDVGGHDLVPLVVLRVEQHQHQVKAAKQRAGQRDVHTQRLQAHEMGVNI